MDGRTLGERVRLVGPWLRARHAGPVRKIGLDAGLGCPHRPPGQSQGGCTFCPPSAAGRGQTGQSLATQIARGLAALERHAARRGQAPPAALAYYQAHTSTHAPAATVARLLAPALAEPRVAGLVVSTRPDCLDAARLDVLARAAAAKPLWLELGLQSAHDATLARVGRGHTVAAFDQAVAAAQAHGLDVVAHVILGLPGEGREEVWATARHLAELGVWGVKLHGLMVLEGAALAQEWREGRFTPWTLEEFVAAAAGFLALLPRQTLIHRLTADPGPDRLLAPAWLAGKDQTLTELAVYLAAHQMEQGSWL
ncbi:MAG: TIGR01212 family radical SAM protein [Deltaproteobacteria bacterium]|nr:TIGR01212 family radical SAM protein [Deltaproteobacteria bacterium]